MEPKNWLRLRMRPNPSDPPGPLVFVSVGWTRTKILSLLYRASPRLGCLLLPFSFVTQLIWEVDSDPPRELIESLENQFLFIWLGLTSKAVVDDVTRSMTSHLLLHRMEPILALCSLRCPISVIWTFIPFSWTGFLLSTPPAAYSPSSHPWTAGARWVPLNGCAQNGILITHPTPLNDT